ncbi:hypothetical protein Bhyg_17372, partial [Pseudolycoriella hygida]
DDFCVVTGDGVDALTASNAGSIRIRSNIDSDFIAKNQFSISTEIRLFCIHRSVVCMFPSQINLLPFKFTNFSRLS